MADRLFQHVESFLHTGILSRIYVYLFIIIFIKGTIQMFRKNCILTIDKFKKSVETLFRPVFLVLDSVTFVLSKLY